MKIIAIVFALTSTSLCFAAPNSETIKSVLEAQPSCSNFVRYDDKNIYLGFGAYKRKSPGLGWLYY